MSSQFEISFGERLRDQGIKLAKEHADKVHSDWSFQAYAHLIQYLRPQPDKFKFMTEDFREHLRTRLVMPPDNRAFGAVMARAVREGRIVAFGFEKSKNSVAHRRPTQVWMKV